MFGAGALLLAVAVVACGVPAWRATRVAPSEALELEASARAALEILSGIQPAVVPECPLELVQSEVVELGDHVDRALANRPEVFQLEAARQATDANLVVKRAGYLPDIILALTSIEQVWK